MPRIKREKKSRIDVKKQKAYKANSLYISLIVSIMCTVMSCFCLLGTTYALFTDSAFSTGNTISSAKIEVQLYEIDEGNISPDRMVKSNETGSKFLLKFDNEKTIAPGDELVSNFAVRNVGNTLSDYSIGVALKEKTDDLSVAENLKIYYASLDLNEDSNGELDYIYLGKLSDMLEDDGDDTKGYHIIGNLAPIKVGQEENNNNVDEVPSTHAISIKLVFDENAAIDTQGKSLSVMLTLISSQSKGNVKTINFETYLYDSNDKLVDEGLIYEDNFAGGGTYYFGDEVNLDTFNEDGNRTIEYNDKIYRLKGIYPKTEEGYSDENLIGISDLGQDYVLVVDDTKMYRLRYEYEADVEVPETEDEVQEN